MSVEDVWCCCLLPTSLLLLMLFSFCWINQSQCEQKLFNIKSQLSQLIESASPRWKQFVWCVFLDSCLWRSEWTWEDLGSPLGHSWHLSCQDPEDCYSKPMKRLGISQFFMGDWIMLNVVFWGDLIGTSFNFWDGQLNLKSLPRWWPSGLSSPLFFTRSLARTRGE